MALPIHVDGYSAYRLNERPSGFELDGVYYRIYALEISRTLQARSISKSRLQRFIFATIKPMILRIFLPKNFLLQGPTCRL